MSGLAIVSDPEKIIVAAREESLQEFVNLEKKGYDIHHADTTGFTPLHASAQHENTEVLEYIIGKTTSIEHKEDDFGRTALTVSVIAGSLKSVEVLVAHGADPNTADKDDNTVVEWAASRSYMDILEILVYAGGRVRNKIVKARLPLNEACRKGDTQVATFLIDHGANLNKRDGSGLTPLENTLHEPGRLGTARLLLDKGAILDLRSDGWGYKFHSNYKLELESKGHYGYTPLAFSCLIAAPESVRFLLDNGADINTETGSLTGKGHKLMDIIIRQSPPKSTEDIVSVLMQKGYDMEEKDANGRTPLLRAVIRGKGHVVSALVKLGVNLNATDFGGTTALTHATRGVSPKDMEYWNSAKILASHKANGDEGYKRYPSLVSFRVGGDWDSYRQMSRRLHTDIDDDKAVAKLILAGADVEAEYIRDGYTPLMRACSRNLIKTVATLLDAGASIDRRGVRGYTSIIICSSKGNTNILRLLLERGADISSKSDTPYTPRRLNWVRKKGTLMGYNSLMVACINGHIDTVDVLLEAAINIDETDSERNTSLHIAAVNENAELVTKLVASGARVNTKNTDNLSPLMVAMSIGRQDIADILILNGAVIEELAMPTLARWIHKLAGIRANQSLNTTFSESEVATAANIPERCPSIHNVMLSDGRCVHMMTRDARRAMITSLHVDVDPTRFVMPIQMSGTCWFFTTISILFVSDRTRKNTLPLRRAMIMGRKTVNGPKFSYALANVYVKLNLMIQNILTGNSNPDSIVPIIGNEEVALGLHENGITRPGLNDGAYTILDGITPLVKSLSTIDGPVSIHSTIWGNWGRGSSSRVYVTEIKKNSRLYATINGRKYIADSIALSGFKHVVAGLTLNGKRVIHDSNMGTVDLDWAEYLEFQTKHFYVGNRRYSLYENEVMILYNLIE